MVCFLLRARYHLGEAFSSMSREVLCCDMWMKQVILYRKWCLGKCAGNKGFLLGEDEAELMGSGSEATQRKFSMAYPMIQCIPSVSKLEVYTPTQNKSMLRILHCLIVLELSPNGY